MNYVKSDYIKFSKERCTSLLKNSCYTGDTNQNSNSIEDFEKQFFDSLSIFEKTLYKKNKVI